MCPIEISSKSGPSPEDEAFVKAMLELLEGGARTLEELAAALDAAPEAAPSDEPEPTDRDTSGDASP